MDQTIDDLMKELSVNQQTPVNNADNTTVTTKQVTTTTVVPIPQPVPTTTSSQTQTPPETTPTSSSETETTPVWSNTTPEIVQNRSAPDIIPTRYYAWNKTILAWTTSEAISKIELIARYEEILLQDLLIKSNAAWFERAIKEVHLYDSEGYLIATERVSSSFVTFNDIDLVLPEWQSNLYVWVTTQPVWYQEIGPQFFSFSLTTSITESKWITSWTTPAMSLSSSSDTYTIVPVAIENVDIVDAFKNRIVDKRLFAWESNLWIIVISTSASTSTTHSGSPAHIELETIAVAPQDYTVVNNIASTLKLKRVNGTWNEINGTLQTDWTVLFDMSLLWSEAIIENGTEEWFIIIWDVALDWSNNNEAVRIDLVDTNTWWIVYRTTDTNSNSISTLNLRYTDHDGIKITE